MQHPVPREPRPPAGRTSSWGVPGRLLLLTIAIDTITVTLIIIVIDMIITIIIILIIIIITIIITIITSVPGRAGRGDGPRSPEGIKKVGLTKGGSALLCFSPDRMHL